MSAISALGKKYRDMPWKKGRMRAWLSEHMVIPGRANYRSCERKAKKK